MKERLFCIFLGFFFVFLGLELLLRILGFGYNVIYSPPLDQGADYKIFCVGESTTWGIGASNPIEKGYPRQLEIMLRGKFEGIKVQCLFDQAIGQNTSEIALKLPYYIVRYRPQLIIFMVGANNWWNLDKSNILLFSNSKVNHISMKVFIFLDKLRIWKLFKNIAFSKGFLKERWDYFWSQRKEEDVLREEKDGIFDELAAHDLEGMAEICKRNGIKMILCNYPMGRKEALTAAEKKIAKKFGAPFVDNFSVFRALKNREEYLWEKDHWHPNDRGYFVVAENIYKCILENKLIEAETKKSSP